MNEVEEQLQREAMEQRPRFSVQLHERIMERIQDEQRAIASQQSFWSGRRLAMAASIMLVFGLTTWWVLHSGTTNSDSKPVMAHDDSPSVHPAIPELASTAAVTVDFNGLISARLSQSGVIVQMPIFQDNSSTAGSDAKPTPSAIVPASPEWMLAQLDASTNTAAVALVDALPGRVRNFVGLGKFPQ